MTKLKLALAAAAVTSAALLGGALAFQYIGGLHPCEMCHWQRWPHIAALVFAAGGGLALAQEKPGVARVAAVLAGLALLVTAAIGLFHVGVEQDWWEGPTACSVIGGGGSVEDIFATVMAAPVIRCDETAWSLAGISMAGYNAIISFLMGGLVLWLSTTRKK
ncbi:disulfide bond formation protein B [Pedomonas mirosovicensis]|uniref:disulfide bond formation protein B n=1 Tax=Pedomonas mirosovicensis TaxID=2908641 RepID=UPI002169107D|nr:disulfide bond formation protein B [Pedomonas mirosovicensis]MCH8684554.1 disulfide bond formation protein B [Pedomonas mirosovicensis]